MIIQDHEMSIDPVHGNTCNNVLSLVILGEYFHQNRCSRFKKIIILENQTIEVSQNKADNGDFCVCFFTFFINSVFNETSCQNIRNEL